MGRRQTKYARWTEYHVDNGIVPMTFEQLRARREIGYYRLLPAMCREAGVKMIRGQANARLVRLDDVPKIIHFIVTRYTPKKLDRLAMVAWLAGIQEESKLFQSIEYYQPSEPGYSRLIEMEINRIARMKEPERTAMATDMVIKLRDARSVAVAAKRIMRERGKESLDSVRDIRKEPWWGKLERLAPAACQTLEVTA